MKYVHIVQFHLMSGGGVGSVVTDVCEAMAKKSEDVYVLSLFQRNGINFEDEKKWAAEKGIHVELFQKDGMSQIAALLALRKYIKALAADDDVCLYMHLKWGVLAGLFASFGVKRVRRIEVYHSGYMNYKLQAFFCKPFINKYISVSKEAKEQLINWFGVKENKIEVVYNGVDVDAIRSLAKKETAEHDGIRFVSVGRLSFEKGFLDPIKAFSLLKNSGSLENCTYTMVGDGDQRAEAEKLADGTVQFTGVVPREDVYGCIGGADAVIMPSLWEGNSILLLEAISVGKALVVTDIPSFREVLGFEPLKDGEEFRFEKFGAIFRKENPDSCKAAIEAMSAVSKEEFSSCAAYAGALADDYSVTLQAEKYMKAAE